MNPEETGKRYDRIARWWHDQHGSCRYGMDQLARAQRFVPKPRSALDVDCGSGGGFIRRQEEHGYIIAKMLQPAAIFSNVSKVRGRMLMVFGDSPSGQIRQGYSLIECPFHIR
jgi:hypothetical protein